MKIFRFRTKIKYFRYVFNILFKIVANNVEIQSKRNKFHLYDFKIQSNITQQETM